MGNEIPIRDKNIGTLFIELTQGISYEAGSTVTGIVHLELIKDLLAKVLILELRGR
jgi:hypothetical protein